MGIDEGMKRGLIVKGRRYYSPKYDEYVVAVTRGCTYSTFRRKSGEVVRLLPKSVCYVSADDYNMCESLARSTRLDTWFDGRFDDATQTEYNYEWRNGRYRRTSYRMAIRDLHEGAALEVLPIPKEYIRRFYEIVKGMGYAI